MQTFLPLTNYRESARVLDNKRLGKQRVEGYQILRTLLGESVGWQNHPAVKMWKGYEDVLAAYTLIVCEVWKERGYKDSITEKVEELCRKYNLKLSYELPWWHGKEEFHASHRAALLLKDPQHYGQFGWREEAKNNYWWPSEHLEMI